MFSAKILADSLHPTGEDRLTTMELTYPRFVHSEFMTHRLFSRNSASSRAIPVEKMLENIMANPVIPINWGKNQKGMQAGDEVSDEAKAWCEMEWLIARDNAVQSAKYLLKNGIHKQIVNRLVEPWMWITVICTGSIRAYANFFKLRCHKDAEPHIQKIAYLARDAYVGSDPSQLAYGFHHLPLVGFAGDDLLLSNDKIKVCIGRCARVSYLTHHGVRDVAADIELHDKLKESGHWSPFEHSACPVGTVYWSRNDPRLSNFGPYWDQYRKQFAPNECATSL